MQAVLHFVHVAIVVALVFGMAVFVHEFGHMMFAILRGVGVESFAIGMGPVITSWRWLGVEFSLRWLPVGGFVKLGGPKRAELEVTDAAKTNAVEFGKAKTGEAQTGPPASEGKDEKSLSESSYDDLLALSDKGLLTKIMVFGGGVFMNFIAAMVAMAVVLMLPKEAMDIPLDVWKVEQHSPLAKAGVQAGDRIVAINGVAVNYPDQLDKTLDDLAEKAGVLNASTDKLSSMALTLTLTRPQGGSTRTLKSSVISVGHFYRSAIEWKLPPILDDANLGMPADKAGMRRGDRVVSVAGHPIVAFNQIKALLADKAGKPVKIEWSRAGKIMSATLTPMLDPITFKGGLIGISNGSERRVRLPGLSPWKAVTLAPGRTVGALVNLAVMQVNFFRKATIKQVGENVGGPVMIARFTARAASYGMVETLMFFITLNLLLMMMNLLPLPVLDGGFILIAFVESSIRVLMRGFLTVLALSRPQDAAKRRALVDRVNAVIRCPVPPSFLGPIYTAFVIFFISAMALITLMDFKHWLF